MLWMKVEQAAENENKWRKQAEEAVAVLAKQVEEKSATPLERLRKKLSMLRKVGSLGLLSSFESYMHALRRCSPTYLRLSSSRGRKAMQ